jgi:hypothetical protein
MAWNSSTKKRKQAVKAGFRSGLEEDVSKRLIANNIPFEFENKELTIEWTAKSRKRTLECGSCGDKEIVERHQYLCDFFLDNGRVLLETKGRFLSADRIKMEAIHNQNEDKLVVMLFSNPNTKLSKSSKTTYASWCNKRGIHWLSFKDDMWVEKLKTLI